MIFTKNLKFDFRRIMFFSFGQQVKSCLYIVGVVDLGYNHIDGSGR